MTVDFVRARLAALQALIPGVSTVYSHVPLSIPGDAVLPVFITRVGEARYETTTLGEQAVLEARAYRMELYVSEIESGQEGQAENLTTPFVDTVRNFFMARPNLALTGSDDVVYRAVLESDTGAVVGIEYPTQSGKFYAGIAFTLRVTEFHSVSYIP